MRILWLTHRDPLNPKAGGAERIVEEVSKRLATSGNEMTIFAPQFTNSRIEESLHGVRIVRRGGNISAHLALPIFLLREHFDVIIADLGHAVPWVSPKVMKRKVIVHFLHLHRRSLPGQVNKILAFAISSLEKCYSLFYPGTRFVTISNTSLSDLTEILHIKAEKCTVIRPGVNSDIYVQRAKTASPSIIYFGGMRDYKRPYESLYVLKHLTVKFPDTTLTAVGDGPSKIKMMQLARDMGMSDHVNFTGRVEAVKLSELVASSWLNVHTSVAEGWGLSIIEAASAGTPTVGYEVPGVTESIESGKNGIKVKNGDRDALFNAAEQIISKPEKWWSSSVEVGRKYSWDDTAEKWGKILREESGLDNPSKSSN